MTCFVWMAHRFVSSKSPTRYASHASWSPIMAAAWICISVLVCLKISYTSLWNGHFLINNPMLFWYLHISLNVTVPGWYIYFLFGGSKGSFLGAFLAIGGPPAFTVWLAAPSVPFLAVWLVLSIIELSLCKRTTCALFVCLCGNSKKPPYFLEVPSHDWLIIGLVTSSTCQSYWAVVSKQTSSNNQEATCIQA